MRFKKYLFPTINDLDDNTYFIYKIRDLISSNDAYLVFPTNDNKHHIALKLINVTGQKIPYKKKISAFYRFYFDSENPNSKTSLHTQCISSSFINKYPRSVFILYR